ncbi:MAG TPA: VC0807 family protein [Ktedonobacteraceae bacterium]|nr:VC0807 family protein [Ktedonobacteraceae bacterium]
MTSTHPPSTTDAQTAQSLQSPSLWTLIIGLWPSILLNGVCVIVVYQLVKHFTTASDVFALMLSAVPAMVGTIITLIRQRSIDVLGAFTLITIVLSIGLAFLTGDARLFLIREAFLTVLFGIVCLISLLFPKPIWFYIIRYFTAGNNHKQMVAYDAAWKFPSFRAYIRTVTILWGVVYTVEFLMRLVMVYTLSISQVLVISSIAFYTLTILASVATFRLGRRLRKPGNAPPTHAETLPS